MSITQYHCGERNRRDAVIADGTLNGIDFLEIATLDQFKLRVGFFLPVATLTKAHFVVEGGVRVAGIVVTAIAGQPGKTITLTVSARGDFSNYTLRLVDPANPSAPPTGFDPQLSSVGFSFKVACKNDFDCKVADDCPPPRVPEPEIDYLAKDYSSFRRLMFDRLSALMPDWRERNPADIQVTLVELLAYAGDHLSYAQDAAATEAYLGTARSRISLRRHARLLDYRLGEGCNARAWVALTVTTAADGKTLPGANPTLAIAGTPLATRLPDQLPLIAKELPASAPRPTIVFETLHDLTLHFAHNEINFHTWSDSACCLPRGATRATLSNQNGLALAPGDLLLFEEICSPVTGLAADADPTHRHVVRLETVRFGPGVNDPLTGELIAEISWRAEDALPFPLCLSASIAAGDDQTKLATVAVARGNIVLADHGRTVADEELVPPTVPAEGNYRPMLPLRDLTFAAPFNSEVVVRDDLTNAIETVEPAINAFTFAAADALPAIRLADSDESWFPLRDLLASDRFAAEFVVEMERDGIARLRFGDAERGGLGKTPTSGARFDADRQFKLTFRVGSGTAGNLGAGALRHIVADPLIFPPGSITAVRNPLPARGGIAPESFDQVRQFAPQAFRRQERAVTEADWADVALRFPGVQRAVARFRWTGSWHTVFVTIDRVGGLTAARDPLFKAGLRAHLERFRLAGYDLEIADPVFVPLDLALLVCVKPGYFRSDVLAALVRVFSTQEFADGTLGFFHPDKFTFGQPLFLSKVCAAAMAVPGVASVEPKKFQRYGRLANHELANALIPAAPLEILRLDNDRNFPENGKIEFDLHGGL